MSNYYKRLREKVGNELIFMPSVAAIVRNDSGEILFQNKRNGEKWSLPAGAIEPGEVPAQAVIRSMGRNRSNRCTQKTIRRIWWRRISL